MDVLVWQLPCPCYFNSHSLPVVAEKTFLSLRQIASSNKDVHCLAISHSDQASTDRWVESVGGSGDVEVIVDHDRKLYAAYGLGVSSWWHVLNPWSMANVFKLGREEKIWNRPTESGSRWQSAGEFAVDGSGIVQYSHPGQTTDDLADFQAAVKSVRSASKQ